MSILLVDLLNECLMLVLLMVDFVHGHNSLKMHEESSSRRKVDDEVHEGAVPAYLLDRENTTRAKVSGLCILVNINLHPQGYVIKYLICLLYCVIHRFLATL